MMTSSIVIVTKMSNVKVRIEKLEKKRIKSYRSRSFAFPAAFESQTKLMMVSASLLAIGKQKFSFLDP